MTGRGGRRTSRGSGSPRPAGAKPPRPPAVIRRSQAVRTWGPGALLDLPNQSAIMGGLDGWPTPDKLDRIDEPRLSQFLKGLPLYAPPRPPERDGDPRLGIGAFRFPEWFVVQEPAERQSGLSRRLVPRVSLEKGSRFEGIPVVATRFVMACPRGHIDDVPWRRFAHGGTVAGAGPTCGRQLSMDEEGTGGDLSELVVRCECGARRRLIEAARWEERPLGPCTGRRPWLGGNDREAGCTAPARLLNRFASNVYFPQVLSVLSLPQDGSPLAQRVRSHWEVLKKVTSADQVGMLRGLLDTLADLGAATDAEIYEEIQLAIAPVPSDDSLKDAELDALVGAPVGSGDGYPGEQPFLAGRLPRNEWHRDPRCDAIEAVVQVHRLREVMAVTGFTRIDAPTIDPTTGEYDESATLAPIAANVTWYPAVESRGEGIFVQLSATAIAAWLARPAVTARLKALHGAFERWRADRKATWDFPGGPYVLLHTLSHLLMQSLAMRCGYPSSALKERVYVDPDRGRYGFLVYTSTADVDGTLGGLVAQAPDIEAHVLAALAEGRLCSNDPTCALHDPSASLERRFTHGAACHGCTLVGETSCETRNEFLDRALVMPVIGLRDAALFGVGG
jgi:hypothetical protein